MQHVFDHLFRRCHMPACQRSLRTRTYGRREDPIRRNGQFDVRSGDTVVVVDEGNRQGRFKVDFAGHVGWEDVQRSEHVFVGLGERGRR